MAKVRNTTILLVGVSVFCVIHSYTAVPKIPDRTREWRNHFFLTVLEGLTHYGWENMAEQAEFWGLGSRSQKDIGIRQSSGSLCPY